MPVDKNENKNEIDSNTYKYDLKTKKLVIQHMNEAKYCNVKMKV